MYKLTDAMSHIFSLSSLQATYWNMYMGVIFAFLAFLLNNWDKKKHPAPLFFLGVGLLLFFASNCRELAVIQGRANARREAVYAYVTAHSGDVPSEFLAFLSERPTPPQVWLVVVLHVVVDLSLLALLAFNYWSTNRKLSSESAT